MAHTAHQRPPTGNCRPQLLFIGHSFFVPIANEMDRLVADASVQGHRQQTVFSGGSSGNPSALWNDAAKRGELMYKLDGGDIDFFGMAMEAETTEFYEKWIDYALAQNADTAIMLGVPWWDYPSDYTTADQAGPVCRGKVPGVIDALRGRELRR